MKECVLVAGGAGYIGTHTAVELIEAGYDVVIVDNLSNSEMKAVEGVREITGRNVPFERVDCDDRQALAGVFDRYRFGAVIHFAASKAFHPRAAPEAGRACGPGHTLRHRAAEQRRGSVGQFPHQRRTGRGRIELPLLFRTTSRQFTALSGRFCAK